MEISWEKELEIAEAYAESKDCPESYMERCLKKAIEKAKKEGIDISDKVERIRKIWNE